MTDEWRKSSRSISQGGASDCVEVRVTDGRFEVRDSKLGDDSPIFRMDTAEFSAFLRAAKR